MASAVIHGLMLFAICGTVPVGQLESAENVTVVRILAIEAPEVGVFNPVKQQVNEKVVQKGGQTKKAVTVKAATKVFTVKSKEIESPLLFADQESSDETIVRDKKETMFVKKNVASLTTDEVADSKHSDFTKSKLSMDKLVFLADKDQQRLSSFQAGVAAKERRESLERAVREQLEAAKYYPASARRRGIVGDVKVAFAVNPAGVAEQVLILASSGYAVLDRAALETVERAQPFATPGGKFQFRLSFRNL